MFYSKFISCLYMFRAHVLINRRSKLQKVLLPNEQMYIQLFHHNNELIPEQHLNDHNHMFDLLHSNTTLNNPPDA